MSSPVAVAVGMGISKDILTNGGKDEFPRKIHENDNLERVLAMFDSNDLVGKLEEASRVLLEIVPFLLPTHDDKHHESHMEKALPEISVTPDSHTAAEETLAAGDGDRGEKSLFQDALAVLCGDLATILQSGLVDPSCEPLLQALDSTGTAAPNPTQSPSKTTPEISSSEALSAIRHNTLFHRLIDLLSTSTGHSRFIDTFLTSDACLERLYLPFALLQDPGSRQRVCAAVTALGPFYGQEMNTAQETGGRSTARMSALSVSVGGGTVLPEPQVKRAPASLPPRSSTPDRLTVPPRPLTRVKQHTRSRSDGLPTSLPSRPSTSRAPVQRLRSHHLARTGTFDGMCFSPPEPGQSLLGYLQSQVDTETCADLERENAHFLISEAVICALEQMHYTRRHGGSDGSSENMASGSPGGSSDLSGSSVGSTSEGVEVPSPSLSQSILRKGTVTTSGPLQNTHSAEAIAISLLKRFRESQIPPASELEWLVAEEDVPEASSLLLPLPTGVCVVPAETQTHCSRIRGNLEWAPLRPQIIYHLQSHVTLKTALTAQKGRCAGCGGRMDAAQQQRMRYCEYTGKYFCVCCHEYKTSVIPARILHKWDFTKYYVSNFAADFIGRIYRDPLFDVNDCDPGLYKKSKTLMHTKELRVQLVLANQYIRTCRKAQAVADEIDGYPRVLSEQVHSYSLEMLCSVRDVILPTFLRPITELATSHVVSCTPLQECGARGFICEFCHSERAIFPFQLTTVFQCSVCGDCFHAKCIRSRPCPRCVRFEARKATRERQLSTVSPEQPAPLRNCDAC